MMKHLGEAFSKEVSPQYFCFQRFLQTSEATKCSEDEVAGSRGLGRFPNKRKFDSGRFVLTESLLATF